MGKLYIETYGCQMNVNDTEVIFSILAKHGYERTEKMEEADVIMANTCSIRDNAEQRIWGRLEQFNIQRKSRKGVLVGILGCMAERLKDALLDSGKVDIVAGPDSYRRLPELISAAAEGTPSLSRNAVNGADKYWVYRSTDGVNFKYYDTTTKTTYTNKSVTAGTTYYYKVKAVKVVNGSSIASQLSNSVSFKAK